MYQMHTRSCYRSYVFKLSLKQTIFYAGNSKDDTVRPDPLEKLRKYRGGYDVTNVHYWSVSSLKCFEVIYLIILFRY